MDAPPPLGVPPKAKDLRWVWLPRASPHLAATIFEDDEPETVFVNPLLLESKRMLVMILLHELTHMRLGHRYSCKWGAKTWREETLRLASLGAIPL